MVISSSKVSTRSHKQQGYCRAYWDLLRPYCYSSPSSFSALLRNAPGESHSQSSSFPPALSKHGHLRPQTPSANVRLELSASSLAHLTKEEIVHLLPPSCTYSSGFQSFSFQGEPLLCLTLLLLRARKKMIFALTLWQETNSSREWKSVFNDKTTTRKCQDFASLSIVWWRAWQMHDCLLGCR